MSVLRVDCERGLFSLLAINQERCSFARVHGNSC